MKKWQPSIYVFCTTCNEYVDEEKIKFVNIEEDMLGHDILTFICPKCKQQKRSKRLG